MSKQPSDATIIRQLRRDLRAEHTAACRHAQDAADARRRVVTVAAEAAEWKRRFDLLLSRATVQLPPMSPGER